MQLLHLLQVATITHRNMRRGDGAKAFTVFRNLLHIGGVNETMSHPQDQSRTKVQTQAFIANKIELKCMHKVHTLKIM